MDRKTISKIVKASGVSSGEMILVHFWGEDADKEIANNFMVAVAENGATPILVQQSRSANRDIFISAKESCFNERYFDFFANLMRCLMFLLIVLLFSVMRLMMISLSFTADIWLNFFQNL